MNNEATANAFDALARRAYAINSPDLQDTLRDAMLRVAPSIYAPTLYEQSVETYTQLVRQYLIDRGSWVHISDVSDATGMPAASTRALLNRVAWAEGRSEVCADGRRRTFWRFVGGQG